jgi:hypothetical protein
LFLDRNKRSIIECNQAEFLSKEELIKRIDPNGPCAIKDRKIPSYLKRDVCRAIIQSPLIALYVKKFIKEKK